MSGSAPLRPVVCIGAVYAGSERGLAADVLAARALGLAPLPVCTSIVVASRGVVTDVLEVPSDTVAAQLEHVWSTNEVAGVKVGILAGPISAAHVLDRLAEVDVPVVLDVVASGPSGETVLSSKGVDAVADRLGVATLVTLSKADAELVTGAEIQSLDDAQVAAQRIVHKGARGVVIRCGSLPYRFYDAADDPGGEPTPFSSDLFFDGDDFALFEAPLISGGFPDGMSSGYAIAALKGFIEGSGLEAVLQQAKRYATEAVRGCFETSDGASRADFFWK